MYLSFISDNIVLFIILLVIAIGAVIFGIVFCIFKLKGSRKSYISMLEKTDEIINNKDSNIIENNLQRLNTLATKNQDYIAINNKLHDDYKHLSEDTRDKLFLTKTGLIDRFRQEPKISKGLIEQYEIYKKSLIEYQNGFDSIKNELNNLFKASDDLRVRKVALASKYQEINKDIEKYSASLSLCKKELQNYIGDAQMYFDLYEDNQALAKYKEATANLDAIENIILNVYGNVETIATYCHYVSEVIPNQLQELIEKNNDLDRKGYVVSFTKVKDFVANTQVLLDDLAKQFKLLCFGDFEDVSAEIQEKIQDINARLDAEVKAKDALDQKYELVSKKVKTTEIEFIQTKRQFATMVEYYKLDDSLKERFKTFQVNTTTLSGLKREYDSFLFVKAKNPASFMLEKVEKMDKIANEVLDDIHYFSNYFYDIKDFVETTYSQIETISVSLIQLVGKINKFKCKTIYDIYIDDIKATIAKLEESKQILESKPIDISILNKEFGNIVLKANELECTVNNNIENYLMVEKCLIFANPLRSDFKEVNTMLDEVECLFKENKLQEAQDIINDILNRYHPVAFDTFNK